jgi:23S rRNA pseudouridine1911/1915/1917 synthase
VSQTRIFECTAPDAAGRIDRFLAEAEPELSRAQVQRLIEEGRVTVNGATVRASRKLAGGETVRVEIPPPLDAETKPEDIALDILFEDNRLIAIAKPRGMVVHPAPGHSSGTVVNALLHHCTDLSGVGGVKRPGIVHRLDKDTSGVLIVAKDDVAHRELQAQFKARTVEKTYLAVVLGTLRGQGTVDQPVGRHPTQRKKMSVESTRGRPSRTHWRSLMDMNGATLLEVRIETGRTHQIRVHMAHLGHPVVGDPLYGGARAKGIMDSVVRRRLLAQTSQALHAWRLEVDHPENGERLRLEAPVPEEMLSLISELGAGSWVDRYRREAS